MIWDLGFSGLVLLWFLHIAMHAIDNLAGLHLLDACLLALGSEDSVVSPGCCATPPSRHGAICLNLLQHFFVRNCQIFLNEFFSFERYLPEMPRSWAFGEIGSFDVDDVLEILSFS